MSKTSKILLAAATLYPFLYMVFFFIAIFSTFPARGSGVPALMTFIIPLHLLAMLSVMALTAFYIVNIFRNERVEKDKKPLWAVVIFMGSIFAMPVYWHLYIWRESEPARATANSAPKALTADKLSERLSDATGREREYVPPASPPDWRS